jgi:hypothetical protein
MMLDPNDLLKEFGGMDKNNLLSILNNQNLNHQDEILQFKQSNYYDFDGTRSFLEAHHGELTILSLNAQSINAKIDEISIFLNFLHLKKLSFDIICIQESWLSTTATLIM